MNIQPNRLIGVIGDHGDFPIEKLRVTNFNLLASCAHDAKVKFHETDSITKSMVSKSKKSEFTKNLNKKAKKLESNNDFFADL